MSESKPSTSENPKALSGYLRMRAIGKEFPGVKALKHVEFEARPGEILALMGENGAGKSTLMKILSGVIPYGEYTGDVLLDQSTCRFYSTKDARKSGVAIIHQELNLFPELSVEENLFLGMEPIKNGVASKFFGVIDNDLRSVQAKKWLSRVGLEHIDIHQPLREYSVGTQQLIEIARALSTEARILIFDEPTSALSLSEVRKLFEILKELRKDGHTLIYISHRMEEVFELADRISVLRDGQSVGTALASQISPDEVVSLMVGRPIHDLYPHRQLPYSNEVVLKISNLSSKSYSHLAPSLRNLSFELKKGEILGVAGLVGSGRSELLDALFGVGAEVHCDLYQISGISVKINTPKDAISNGLAFVTENRKENGLLLGRSLSENICLAALKRLSEFLVMDEPRSENLVSDYFKKLRIKAPNSKVEASSLSGGNQQKVVLAKWLALSPKILLLDEPTRGIDVGARQEIYRLIMSLAESGISILMVSSDLPEVLGLSDRVMVMRDGKNAGVLEKGDATQEKVMRLAAGLGSDSQKPLSQESR